MFHSIIEGKDEKKTTLDNLFVRVLKKKLKRLFVKALFLFGMCRLVDNVCCDDSVRTFSQISLHWRCSGETSNPSETFALSQLLGSSREPAASHESSRLKRPVFVAES